MWIRHRLGHPGLGCCGQLESDSELGSFVCLSLSPHSLSAFPVNQLAEDREGEIFMRFGGGDDFLKQDKKLIVKETMAV